MAIHQIVVKILNHGSGLKAVDQPAQETDTVNYNPVLLLWQKIGGNGIKWFGIGHF